MSFAELHDRMDAIHSLTEHGLDSLQSLTMLLREKAQLDREYARSLHRLGQKAGLGGHEKTRAMQKALAVFSALIETIAANSEVSAEKLTGIAAELQQTKERLVATHKSLANRAQRIAASNRQSYEYLEACRGACEKAYREADEAREMLESEQQPDKPFVISYTAVLGKPLGLALKEKEERKGTVVAGIIPGSNAANWNAGQGRRENAVIQPGDQIHAIQNKEGLMVNV